MTRVIEEREIRGRIIINLSRAAVVLAFAFLYNRDAEGAEQKHRRGPLKGTVFCFTLCHTKLEMREAASFRRNTVGVKCDLDF